MSGLRLNEHVLFHELCSYRPIKGIRGFSRETVIALLTNIESQEYVRRQHLQQNESPEHPRASSTDDVECFFSVLHNQLGLNYNLKAIQNRWRVICNEFTKKRGSTQTYHSITIPVKRIGTGYMICLHLISQLQVGQLGLISND